MLKHNAEILTEEKIAINKFINERNAMAHDMRAHMNKATYKKNFGTGLLGGMALGLTFGMLLAPAHSHTPIRDANGHVTAYKKDAKKMANSMLSTIAFVTLAALMVAAIQTAADTSINRRWADMLSHDTLKKYFGKPLETYNANTDLIHVIRATALILNNMPNTELERLRALAIDGMVCDVNGFYSVRPAQIATATQIISNFIQYNPELGHNVLRIMRGDNPTTYFLTSLMQQKTK